MADHEEESIQAPGTDTTTDGDQPKDDTKEVFARARRVGDATESLQELYSPTWALSSSN